MVCIVAVLAPLRALKAIAGVVLQQIQHASGHCYVLYIILAWQRDLCPVGVIDYIVGKCGGIQNRVACRVDSLIGKSDAIYRYLFALRTYEVGINELAFADVEGLNTIVHCQKRQTVLDRDGVAVLAHRRVFVVQVSYVVELSVTQQIHLAVGIHDHQRLHRFEPLDAGNVIAVHAVLITIGANVLRLCVDGKQRA